MTGAGVTCTMFTGAREAVAAWVAAGRGTQGASAAGTTKSRTNGTAGAGVVGSVIGAGATFSATGAGAV